MVDKEAVDRALGECVFFPLRFALVVAVPLGTRVQGPKECPGGAVCSAGSWIFLLIVIVDLRYVLSLHGLTQAKPVVGEHARILV